MSSSSWSTDGSSDKVQGYVDYGIMLSASSSTSTSGSTGTPARQEIVYEDYELNMDNTRVWTELILPPPVPGYDWAPYEVHRQPPYFITTDFVRRLIE